MENKSSFIDVLNQAKTKEKPTIQEMIAALLLAEKTAKRERLKLNFADLTGEWQLYFATSTHKLKKQGGIRLGRGYFWSKLIPARIGFNAETLMISNQVKVGAVEVKFTGPCRWEGKKNLLAFDFTNLSLSIFGQQIYTQKIRRGEKGEKNFITTTIAYLPFFAFFYADSDKIAARGRGGGLALWVKNENI